jgi:hypothetical protein
MTTRVIKMLLPLVVSTTAVSEDRPPRNALVLVGLELYKTLPNFLYVEGTNMVAFTDPVSDAARVTWFSRLVNHTVQPNYGWNSIIVTQDVASPDSVTEKLFWDVAGITGGPKDVTYILGENDSPGAICAIGAATCPDAKVGKVTVPVVDTTYAPKYEGAVFNQQHPELIGYAEAFGKNLIFHRRLGNPSIPFIGIFDAVGQSLGFRMEGNATEKDKELGKTSQVGALLRESEVETIYFGGVGYDDILLQAKQCKALGYKCVVNLLDCNVPAWEKDIKPELDAKFVEALVNEGIKLIRTEEELTETPFVPDEFSKPVYPSNLGYLIIGFMVTNILIGIVHTVLFMNGSANPKRISEAYKKKRASIVSQGSLNLADS